MRATTQNQFIKPIIMNKIVFTLAFLSAFFNLSAQTILYSEDFSGQVGKGILGPQPITFDTAGVTWTLDSGSVQLTTAADYAAVNASTQFECRNLDGEFIWYSDTVDISGVTAVNLRVSIAETGDIEGTDYLNVYYILDNLPEVPFTSNGLNPDDFGTLIATSDSIIGTTIQIVIKVKNNSGTEKHFFDSIIVYENIAEVQSFYDLPDQTNIQLKWQDPASAFDEVMIVASLNSQISAGTPTGNGSQYTANAIIGNGTALLGGTVIFKGTANSTIFSGAAYTDSCFVKIFTRKGFAWSKGKELHIYYNPPTLGDIRITEYARHATISDYSYLEIYNTTNADISLAGGKIIAKNLSSVSKVIDFSTEIPNPIIVPANGFLILNRDRSKANFQSTWNVNFSTLTDSVSYNRTGENNFGNLRFFQYKHGGTENTDDGAMIDESTLRPSVGERVFQLPYSYWNKMGSVADSATPGYFATIENPEQINFAYSSGSWNPSAPSSFSGIHTAAVIDGNAPFANNTTLLGLYIWNNGGTNITTQNVTLNSFLTIENNGSLTITGSGSVNCSGITKVKRNGLNINSDYNIWGTPFNTLLDLQTVFPNANPCDMYVFKASTQEYKYDFTVGSTITCTGNITSTISSNDIIPTPEGAPDGKLDVGRGYFIPGNADSTITFSNVGATLNNGNISVNIAGSSGTIVSGSNDWNLISNPYPSAISANSFITTNLGLITNAIYVYDQGLTTSSFSTYNSTDGFNIASCQGFFVDANSTTDGFLGTVNFTNSMRNNQNDDFRSTDNIQSIYLSATNSQNQKDVMRIYFDENSEEGFDYAYDANKMMNATFNLASRVNERNLVFNGIPELTDKRRIIPLYFNTSTQNTFSISIDSLIGDFTGKDFILEDRYLRKFHPINSKSYTFKTDANEWNNRFFLHVLNASSPTGIEDFESLAVKIISLENEVVVSVLDENTIINSIELLDVKGQLITTISGSSNTVSIPITGISSGVYLVKFVLNTGKLGVEKVVIR